MAFLVYKRTTVKGKDLLSKTSDTYSLAGHNLIYSAWKHLGKPVNQGWRIGVDELIRIWSGGANDRDSIRFLIDFHPGSKKRIGIIELLKVFAYTYADDKRQIVWTPMMFSIRDVFYKEFDKDIDPYEKERLIREFDDPNYGQSYLEFLYLNGDKHGWNWGATGQTNGAFIEGKAREYFREFF